MVDKQLLTSVTSFHRRQLGEVLNDAKQWGEAEARRSKPRPKLWLWGKDRDWYWTLEAQTEAETKSLALKAVLPPDDIISEKAHG